VVGDDVTESIVHQTAVAAVVALRNRAVHEVLLGKRDEALGGEEVSTFCGSGGTEGPARSALSMVFNGGNSSLFSPVPGIRSINIESGNVQFTFLSRDVAIVERFEFGGGEVREFVKSDIETTRGRVEGRYKVDIGLEGLIFCLEFIVEVNFVVSDHVLPEVVLVVRFRKSK
jgi:hypothetical protein